MSKTKKRKVQEKVRTIIVLPDSIFNGWVDVYNAEIWLISERDYDYLMEGGSPDEIEPISWMSIQDIHGG